MEGPSLGWLMQRPRVPTFDPVQDQSVTGGTKSEYSGDRIEESGLYPTCSMYAIFSYIYRKLKPNVGKYSSPMEHLGMGGYALIYGSIVIFAVWLIRRS